MAKSSTTLKKGQNNKRGKTFLTKVLEVMQAEAMENVTADMTKEQIEVIYLKKFIERAFNPDDPASSALMSKMLDKSYKSLKPVMEEVKFSLPRSAKTPAQKASAILDAISNGEIPPDVGATLIGAAKSLVDIEMATDVKDRLEALEQLNGL